MKFNFAHHYSLYVECMTASGTYMMQTQCLPTLQVKRALLITMRKKQKHKQPCRFLSLQ